MRNVVLFVANDKILHYLRPFLASFRRHMPDYPAILIPYDDDIRETRQLAEFYNIDILTIGEVSPLISELSKTIYKRDVGHLKKMQSFAFDADNILIIDVDVLILSNLGSIIDKFAASNCAIAYGEQSSDYVYSADGLANFPHSKLFSCGVMIVAPCRLGLQEIWDTVMGNLDEFTRYQKDGVQEQPIINYVVDKLGRKAVNFHELDNNISSYNYYLRKEIKVEWPGISPRLTIDGKEVVLLHFAGLKDVTKEFKFRDMVEYYRLKCGEESELKV